MQERDIAWMKHKKSMQKSSDILQECYEGILPRRYIGNIDTTSVSTIIENRNMKLYI